MSETESMRAEAFDAFFKKQARLISDYAQAAGITFERGQGWAIHPETGQAFYDPELLLKRGYSEQEALFLTLHETEHFRDAKEILGSQGGRKIWEMENALYEEGGRKKVLANVVGDIHDDARVTTAFPNLLDSQRRCVTETAIPERDLLSLSRHMQFIWALRREAAAPDEPCSVAPEVRAAIDKLHALPVPGKQKNFDVVSGLMNRGLDGRSRIMLLKKYIEPSFEALYQLDLADQNQNKDQNDNQGEKNQNQQPQNSPDQPQQGGAQPEQNQPESQPHQPEPQQDPFQDEYDKFDNAFPRLLDEEQVQEAVEQVLVKEGNENGLGKKVANTYAAEHGVLPHEVEDYRREYEKIEPFIKPISDTIEALIEDRKIPGRKLTKVADQGVMFVPGMEVQAWMDMKDETQSKIMLDYEGRDILKPIVGSLRFRFVCDLSISMDGTKQEVQRRIAQLLLESVSDISQRIEDNVGQMEHELNVKSEIATFGSPDLTRVVKPLSSELSERQRVDVFNALSHTGGSTPDFLSLETIVKEMDDEAARDKEYAEKLKEGEIKEVVIVLTDGASDDAAAVKVQLEALRKRGARVLAIGMTNAARTVLETYAPDAQLVEDVEKLPEVFQALIQEVFGDLFTHSRPQKD